jgi:hypothetical protein
MTFEKIQYPAAPLSKPLGLMDLTLFVVGPGLATWLITSDYSTALLYGFYGFVVMAIVKSIARYRSLKRSFVEAKAHLTAQSFKTDLEFSTHFAIDSAAGKIAFVEPLTMSYDLYDMVDILGCEHQWINKSDSNDRLTKKNNVLIFKTRNPHQPLYKFGVLSHATGELWLARINALLNS